MRRSRSRSTIWTRHERGLPNQPSAQAPAREGADVSILVGYGLHNNNDRSAIELACQLARSERLPVQAVSVVPKGWGTPAAAGTDREFEAWANDEGEAGAEQARAAFALHPGIEASASWVSGRSVPQSLLEQAAERDVGPGRRLQQ